MAADPGLGTPKRWRSGLLSAHRLLHSPTDRPGLTGVGRLWCWLGVLALAWSAVLAVTWWLASGVSRNWVAGLPIVQVIAVLVVVLVSPLRVQLAALAERLGGSAPAGAGAAASVLTAILALALLAIQPHSPDWSTWLPLWLRWLRPEALYRPLMLMPLWGVWAMMPPLHFCRACEATEPLLRRARENQPVLATAFWMALPLAGTLWQLNFIGAWMILPAAGALLAGSVGSVALCRTGGLTRRNLLAGAFAAQLTFLLCYVAAKQLY